MEKQKKPSEIVFGRAAPLPDMVYLLKDSLLKRCPDIGRETIHIQMLREEAASLLLAYEILTEIPISEGDGRSTADMNSTIILENTLTWDIEYPKFMEQINLTKGNTALEKKVEDFKNSSVTARYPVLFQPQQGEKEKTTPKNKKQLYRKWAQQGYMKNSVESILNSKRPILSQSSTWHVFVRPILASMLHFGWYDKKYPKTKQITIDEWVEAIELVDLTICPATSYLNEIKKVFVRKRGLGPIYGTVKMVF